MFTAKVYVTLKPTVSDPQGRTVLGGLRSLGFTMVSDVRIGKYLQITVDESERKQANAKIEEMCEELLANPVIEEYKFELEET